MKKAYILNCSSLVQTGKHARLLIAKLGTKAKIINYAKALAAVRRDVIAETGQQS